MNEDIFSGIDPVDSSVVQFGVALLHASKLFNSCMLTPTVESVFGPKAKNIIKYHVKCSEHNVNVNRRGYILTLRKGDEYPVGVPSSISDYTLTADEAQFYIKRGMCEAA